MTTSPSSAPLPSVELPGVPVPLTRVVLGTMSFGDTADADASRAMLDAAFENGVTGIDTANGYAQGRTEPLIAPWVKQHRDRIVLATKAGMPHPDADGRPPLSPDALRASVEGSLRRLDVDCVDLFYLHQPDRETPLEQTMDTLAQLHAEGKFRALGVSNYAAWQAADVAAHCAQRRLPAVCVGQNVYNLLARRIEDEWLEYATTHDVLTMCYNPLAGGLLVTRPGGALPSRFAGSALAEMYSKRYLSPALVEAVAALSAAAHEGGIPLVEAALRWVFFHAGVGAVLLGGNRVDQLAANLRAVAAGPLPDDLSARLTEISDGLKGHMPAYNR